jgi:hypothetical protein
LPGLFLWLLTEAGLWKTTMTPTPTHSRSRQAAETAFAKIQAPILLRKSAGQKCDPIAQARQEKTLRLRTARLAKETEDLRLKSATWISPSTKKA